VAKLDQIIGWQWVAAQLALKPMRKRDRGSVCSASSSKNSSGSWNIGKHRETTNPRKPAKLFDIKVIKVPNLLTSGSEGYVFDSLNVNVIRVECVSSFYGWADWAICPRAPFKH
jgi:hypothetical protein